MRFASIASGSSGNCIYTGSDRTHLLIDSGISAKKIDQGLRELGLSGNDVNGILITHEHTDHICGLGVMLRKYHIPVYATERTIRRILNTSTLGAIPRELFHAIHPDEGFSIGDLDVEPIRISHDAADPCAYRVEHEGKAAAVMTDLGEYSGYTVEHLQNLDVLLLEANHDIRMLETGPYPYYLKQRILGTRGHLSNESAGHLLCEVLHDNIRHIFLGHLSKENNYPDLAYESVKVEISLGECPYRGSDFPITVASREKMSEIVYF
ncbi:MAG: MBL fold metallo-hydrolase [Lachnospiraceae bacterium]|nr:MBL fold metallo-hydrolase [Lachnospiraceae bacterium]